jgi:hypothetical protein
MATTNNITGDEIKSRVYTADGRFNYDLIFGKKTAHEWIDFHPDYRGSQIIDEDGWRDDGTSLNSKISFNDFKRRFNASTVLAPLNYIEK